MPDSVGLFTNPTSFITAQLLTNWITWDKILFSHLWILLLCQTYKLSMLGCSDLGGLLSSIYIFSSNPVALNSMYMQINPYFLSLIHIHVFNCLTDLFIWMAPLSYFYTAKLDFTSISFCQNLLLLQSSQLSSWPCHSPSGLS